MKIVRLDKTTLRDILLRHGTDISTWPKDLQSLARLNLQNPEFIALIEEEKRFEAMLHSNSFEPARPGLAERIITAASLPRYTEPMWQSFYHAPLMKPAAFGAMLVIGFAIGFGAVVEKTQTLETTPLQSYSDDI